MNDASRESLHHEALSQTKRRKVWVAAAIALVLFFFAQCVHTAKTDSVSWDESQHLYSGWLSWEHADFGFNPEVPPLVKMWCAIPLLHRDMMQPPYVGGDFKREGFVLGQRFLAGNGIDRTLIPARVMAAILSALLALTIFLLAREMFGDKAALVALTLFCFDPNFLAHGSFVTTDVGASLTLLWSIYSFHRVLLQPSWFRIAMLGIAMGLTFTAKFTGVFVLPMIVLIALLEAWRSRADVAAPKAANTRRLLAISSASLIGLLCIWAVYRFHYPARPAGLSLDPASDAYLSQLASPFTRKTLLWISHQHLLPEAYIYGLADTKISAASLPSYLFGHLTHRASRWYYPAAFAIKSTLPFLILLLITLAALFSGRWRARREAVVLLVPPLVLFLIASASDIGIGFRHLFPIYPMLYVLIAGCVSHLVTQNRGRQYVLGALLVWQIVIPFAARPGLLTYANEAWGGPTKTHLYLSDSNTDWGQQLKYVKAYLDKRPGRPCYFAYFEQGAADYRDYGIQCKVLPTGSGSWAGMDSMRFGSDPNVSGLVLISDGVLAGADIPGTMNPYAQFKDVAPSAVIDRSVYVYDGTFRLGPAAATEHLAASNKLLQEKRPADALSEARIALALDSGSATAWKAEGDALEAMGQLAAAREAYQSALRAPELDPVFANDLADELHKLLR